MIGRHERGRTTSMRTKIFILIGAGALLFLTINFLFAPSTGDAACGDKSNKSVSKLMDELKTETKRREELKRQYEELEHKVERLTVDLAVARANKGSPAATAVQSTPLIETTPRYPIPIVIFTYNRPQYLERALNSIFSQMPSENFPVIVSQDDQKPEVTALIARMRESHPLIHLQRTNRTLPAHVPQNQAAYYQIAGHYKFALSHVFDTLQYSSVILLEEDIEVAPDFFTYFAALQWLLFTDRSLYCVSAWNDNGLGKLVDDSEAVYRSNFFPGLGWMLTKQLWNELKDKWPAGYWDDWLREPAQRRNRDCIRPEISRTYTFGESGASGGQFYAQHLKPIKLNDRVVDWHNKDLTHLLKDRWTEEFQATLSRAREVSRVSEISGPGDVKLIYRSQSELSEYSRQFGLIDDAKAGVPRTAYDGVLTFKWQGARVFLAPASYA